MCKKKRERKKGKEEKNRFNHQIQSQVLKHTEYEHLTSKQNTHLKHTHTHREAIFLFHF